MTKLKTITLILFYMITIFFFSAYSTAITKKQSNVNKQEQSNSIVSGIYEFQTSWLQSTANFKSDGTFEMSYNLGGTKTTSGTWAIKKDILILKNEDNFPANKKWLIKDDKLYPIKSSKEYDMNFFYVSKKE
ncbi:hypothetical protein [Flavobacterium mesophilum]|uniref:hypothetical protein n=1 Tax=Flavobacterium mesophilum TaxID=3143495 RepID=UPI0031CEB269